MHIAEFGHSPNQLFRRPHPRKKMTSAFNRIMTNVSNAAATTTTFPEVSLQDIKPFKSRELSCGVNTPNVPRSLSSESQLSSNSSSSSLNATTVASASSTIDETDYWLVTQLLDEAVRWRNGINDASSGFNF